MNKKTRKREPDLIDLICEALYRVEQNKLKNRNTNNLKNKENEK